MCRQLIDRTLCAACTVPYVQFKRGIELCPNSRGGVDCGKVVPKYNDQLAPTNGGRGGMCEACVVELHQSLRRS